MLEYHGSHSGKGHHYIGHHLSTATQPHEGHPPLAWRPYLPSICCHLSLHVVSDVTPLPKDLSSVATYETSHVHFPHPLALQGHFIHCHFIHCHLTLHRRSNYEIADLPSPLVAPLCLVSLPNINVHWLVVLSGGNCSDQ